MCPSVVSEKKIQDDRTRKFRPTPETTILRIILRGNLVVRLLQYRFADVSVRFRGTLFLSEQSDQLVSRFYYLFPVIFPHLMDPFQHPRESRTPVRISRREVRSAVERL